MTDVHLRPQPRIDVLVTDFETEDRRLRTDYAGVAWLGDEPDEETGLMGSEYTRRDVDTQLFLPDTHWYDADPLEGVEVQVTAGVLQVAPTARAPRACSARSPSRRSSSTSTRTAQRASASACACAARSCRTSRCRTG